MASHSSPWQLCSQVELKLCKIGCKCFSCHYWTDTRPQCTQLHERSEALRTQIGSLEALCTGYNGVRRTMLPIEQPLLQSTLSAVDAELQSGLLVCSGSHCCCHPYKMLSSTAAS